MAPDKLVVPDDDLAIFDDALRKSATLVGIEAPRGLLSCCLGVLEECEKYAPDALSCDLNLCIVQLRQHLEFERSAEMDDKEEMDRVMKNLLALIELLLGGRRFDNDEKARARVLVERAKACLKRSTAIQT